MEVLQINNNQQSTYTLAVNTIKDGLQELLEYLKNNHKVFIPSLNITIELDCLSAEENIALEKRCQDYLFAKLNNEILNINNKNKNIKR